MYARAAKHASQSLQIFQDLQICRCFQVFSVIQWTPGEGRATMLAMTRKDSSRPAKKLRRKGNPVAARISDALHAALIRFQQSHDFPPDNNAVVTAALQLYLKEKGFYKPPQE
jgi:hypothetical protein